MGTELSGAVDAEINERHALSRCGDCELRWGNMRDEQWWDFLTKAREGGHMKVFVNNFADVMGHRSTENGADARRPHLRHLRGAPARGAHADLE